MAQKQGEGIWNTKARMLLYRLPEGVRKQRTPGMGTASVEAIRLGKMPGASGR